MGDSKNEGLIKDIKVPPTERDISLYNAFKAALNNRWNVSIVEDTGFRAIVVILTHPTDPRLVMKLYKYYIHANIKFKNITHNIPVKKALFLIESCRSVLKTIEERKRNKDAEQLYTLLGREIIDSDNND